MSLRNKIRKAPISLSRIEVNKAYRRYYDPLLGSFQEIMVERYFHPIQYSRLKMNIENFFEAKSKSEKMPKHLYKFIQEYSNVYLNRDIYSYMEKFAMELSKGTHPAEAFPGAINLFCEDFPIEKDLNSMKEFILMSLKKEKIKSLNRRLC